MKLDDSKQCVFQKNNCQIEWSGYSGSLMTDLKSKLGDITKALVAEYNSADSIKQIGSEKIPSKESVIEIIKEIEQILFPGYFGDIEVCEESLEYDIGANLFKIYDKLSGQISKSFRHKCAYNHYKMCIECYNKSATLAFDFLKQLPNLRNLICDDIRAAFDGDPAAKSYDEIVFSYPGFKAILIYRIAHALNLLNIPLLPRIMTEYAHSVTGVDIHPGAQIGRRFFIDHGTGVVIGETTVIGNNVKIYQGVTLGALSVPKNKPADDDIAAGDDYAKFVEKRHPTIEDDCIIYAGATILGGNTIIGKNSIIGGNVWLTSSVEPHSKIMSQQHELNYYSKKKRQ